MILVPHASDLIVPAEKSIIIPRFNIAKYKKDLEVLIKPPPFLLKGIYYLYGFYVDSNNKPISERTLLVPPKENLITDAGLEYMATHSDYLACSMVGTSNTPPTVGDTTMSSYLAGKTNIYSQTRSAQTTAPYYANIVTTWRYEAGVGTGTWAELGVSNLSNNSGTLFSHALVVDGGGSPTTISKTASMVIDVVYELRCYPPLTDNTGTVGGYAYTSRACNVDSAADSDWYLGRAANYDIIDSYHLAYNGAIGAITASPSGTADSVTSYTPDAYTALSNSISAVLTFGLDDGNLAGGISALAYQIAWARYQMSFSPAIPKTNSQTLSIQVDTSWARL